MIFMCMCRDPVLGVQPSVCQQLGVGAWRCVGVGGVSDIKYKWFTEQMCVCHEQMLGT